MCILAIAFVLTAPAAFGQPFPVLQGDPVDGFGRAWPILPGVPLITANEDGDFKPPVVDPGTIGDVDLVVRAGHLAPGATMPLPALVPPTATAGGSRLPGGSDIPFTVIASDGDPAVAGGHPLLGPELDGIPVVVFAFADLDRDGVVGPTNADPDGAADNARELQEASFPVGMRVAYFHDGVAQGVIASDIGAPLSAGGLPVVLTAAAYVGQFSIDFFLGTVPDGPAITTLQPFFPRLDPDRVVDTDGSAGPALPDGRIAIELESEFEPPVDDAVLGTPFALPVDGSSVTIDRVLVAGATVSRARFVRPASTSGLTGEEPRLPLRPGAGGALFEPLASVTIADDGPGTGVSVRLVPADVLDDVTDPAEPLVVDLVASAGAAIAAPDLDGDPLRERVSLEDAGGVDVVVDDAGGGNDSGAQGWLDVELDGVPVDRLAVHMTAGPPGGSAPVVATLGVEGGAEGIALECPVAKTVVATVTDADGDASGVTVTLVQGGALAQVELAPSGSPASGLWAAALPLPSTLAPGTVVLQAIARDGQGHLSGAATTSLAVAPVLPPAIDAVEVTPSPLPTGARTRVTVSAHVIDDCGVRRVTTRVQRRSRSRRFVRLKDRGKKGDAVAGDGVFAGRRRLAVHDEPEIAFEITARDRKGERATRTVTVPVAP